MKCLLCGKSRQKPSRCPSGCLQLVRRKSLLGVPFDADAALRFRHSAESETCGQNNSKFEIQGRSATASSRQTAQILFRHGLQAQLTATWCSICFTSGSVNFDLRQVL